MYVSVVVILSQLILLMSLTLTSFSFCGSAPSSTSQPKVSMQTTPVQKEKKKRKKKSKKEEETSHKVYPAFVMPSKSEMKKIKSAEDDKKKKIKEGFYQEKSDQDDTLENVESLHLEKSDKTRRRAKKEKKKIN